MHRRQLPAKLGQVHDPSKFCGSQKKEKFFPFSLDSIIVHLVSPKVEADGLSLQEEVGLPTVPYFMGVPYFGACVLHPGLCLPGMPNVPYFHLLLEDLDVLACTVTP